MECAFLDYINTSDNLRLLCWVDKSIHPQEIDQQIDAVMKLVGLYDVKKKKQRPIPPI